MRSLLPLVVALAASACQSTPIAGFHPAPGDFARIHLETTDTNLRYGPLDLQLKQRLVRTFGGTLEVSVGGQTVLIRVEKPRQLDFAQIDRDCQYAGFRLDVLAIEADVHVTNKVLVFDATGQTVPMEANSETGNLPTARRWVRILGAGPAWPLAARLLEGEPSSGGVNYTSMSTAAEQAAPNASTSPAPNPATGA